MCETFDGHKCSQDSGVGDVELKGTGGGTSKPFGGVYFQTVMDFTCCKEKLLWWGWEPHLSVMSGSAFKIQLGNVLV